MIRVTVNTIGGNFSHTRFVDDMLTAFAAVAEKRMVGPIKAGTPVDTGALQSSVGVRRGPRTVQVGYLKSAPRYAPFVPAARDALRTVTRRQAYGAAQAAVRAAAALQGAG